MEELNEEIGLDLKCPTCGNNLLMTDKGLSCPNCDKVKALVLRKTWFGQYEVIESKNVFAQSKFLSHAQCEDLAKKGVDIHVVP